MRPSGVKSISRCQSPGNWFHPACVDRRRASSRSFAVRRSNCRFNALSVPESSNCVNLFARLKRYNRASMVSENQVLGRCRLVRKLGEGGMGVVWLARHETLQKDVAVKVLPPGYAHEADAVQRFLREARAAARLEHPNVIQVLDAGSEGGTHFIVMQYVDGTDLQKILKKKGKLDVADSLAVAMRVALALAAAHKMGMVHRERERDAL